MNGMTQDFGESTESEDTSTMDDDEPSVRMECYETLKNAKSICNKYVAKVEKADNDKTAPNADKMANLIKSYVFDGDYGDSVQDGMRAPDHREKYGTGDHLTEAANIETRQLTDDEREILNANVNGESDERVEDETWILPEGFEIAPDNPQEQMERLKEWADEPHYEDEEPDEEPALENAHGTCAGTTADGSPCQRNPDGEYCFQHEPEDGDDEPEPANESDERTTVEVAAAKAASGEELTNDEKAALFDAGLTPQ